MQPLDALLHRLESAGFRISPADRLRVVQLLDTMGRECLEDPRRLRMLLAPVLARSAAEQSKFYEVFDQWLPSPESSQRTKEGANSQQSSRLRWMSALLLVALGAFAWWYFNRPDPKPIEPSITKTENSGDSLGRTSPPIDTTTRPKSSEKDLLKPQLPIKELLLAEEKETPRPSWLAWMLLALLTLASAWMWWKWARRKAPLPPEPKRTPSPGLSGGLQGDFADAPPYTIPFRGQESYIRTGREQYRLADAMRQRQQGEHPYMDVPASVQATLDKGGFPSLRFRMRRQPADYLCIIEEKYRQSHLTRLFKFFAEHIRGQDVALEIFQASSSLDRFWNAQYPGGLSLDQLQRLFPAHRLLVFGDAHALLDVAASGQARVRPELGAAFRRWRQRVLFTPNAPATWTFEERALYELFALFPATLRGLNDAAHHIEASIGVSADDEAPPSFARWRERAQQRANGPAVALRAMAGEAGKHDHRYTRWRDASDHEEYLAGRPDLLLWLRALAVYPTPTWEITLAIGQGLEKQGVIVHPDDLLTLSRIGWLQTGRMPADLREEFMEDLPKEAEAAARRAVIVAMEAARAEAGSGFAGIELEVNVAIQEFALSPQDPEKQEVMRFLFEGGRVNKVQEQVADLALAKTSEVFKTSEVSGGAREFVGKKTAQVLETALPKRPFLTTYFWGAMGLTVILGMFLLYFYVFFSVWEEKRFGRESLHSIEWNLYRWESSADSATIWNNRGVQAWNERRDTAEAMLQFKRAYLADTTGILTSVMKDTTLSYPGNILGAYNHQMLRYNLAAEALNTLFEKIPLPPSDLSFYSKTIQIQKSREFFGPNLDPGLISSCAIRLVGTERDPLFVDLEKSKIISIQKDAIHAKGLILIYYLSRDGAEKSYRQLITLDSAYFINLRSPRPNLETLLGIFSDRVVSVETRSDARGKLQGTVYFQLKIDPRAPILLQAELLDKNGVVLTQSSTMQRNASRGLNQGSFVLPGDSKTPAFLADSLRIRIIPEGKNAKTLALWTSVNRFVWKGEEANPRIESNPGEKPFLTLYFDKDQPDGRSLQTTTNLDYQATYVNFIRKKEEYMNGYARGLSGSAKEAALASMDNFFEQEVRGGWNSFFSFNEELYTMLEQGDTIRLELNGYGSESNSRQYEEALTLRRVSCVVNHFKIFDGGVFLPYISNGQLLITGSSNVNVKKQFNPGVYSLDAARSRKVELFFTKKSKTIPERSIDEGKTNPPAPDADGDGIPDSEDKCPNEKGDESNGGCPLPYSSNSNCNKLIQDGNRLMKSNQFEEALKKLNAAKTCDPALSSKIDGMIGELFSAVNRQRDEAIKAQNTAESNEKSAKIATIISQITSNMVPIPGGTFTMGRKDKKVDQDECPHQVTVPYFRMSKYEVTQAQWHTVMGQDPPELYNKGCDECPVEGISWEDVQGFLQKLNTLSGQQYRLPTEAEWEYAAKGGQEGQKNAYKYAGSDNLDEVAWYSNNYKQGNTNGERKTTHPVGQKKANQLGLYDMSGNVWEWCQDTYKPYPCDKKTDADVSVRVLRGGSWNYDPYNARSAIRNWYLPSERYGNLGFRVVRGY